MRKYKLLISFLLVMSACESNAPGIDPLVLEKDFCPYLRFFDTYCNGDRAWRSDEQWKEVIEGILLEQGVQAKEIILYYRQPKNANSECPCGEITGHYAEILVDEQDKVKLTSIGFKQCEDSK